MTLGITLDPDTAQWLDSSVVLFVLSRVILKCIFSEQCLYSFLGMQFKNEDFYKTFENL